MKLEISQQILDFVRHLSPAPRRQVREALRQLAAEQGDICALEADLAGFYRLRCGRYRIIFWYHTRR